MHERRIGIAFVITVLWRHDAIMGLVLNVRLAGVLAAMMLVGDRERHIDAAVALK